MKTGRRPAISAFLRSTVLLAAVVTLAQGQGSLVILDPTINGDTVTLPIHLQGNVLDGVAALDFQLSYDASILQPVQVYLGEAAARAGKEIQARVSSEGQYVVLMFGLGRSAVAQGEVARIALTKLHDPKDGQTPVTIVNTKFSTVSSVEIPSQGSTATLLFDNETENDNGDSDGLPPVFNGGIPGDSNPTTDGPRGTTPDASSVVPEGVTKTGGGNTFDLAAAREAAEERLSMLRGAQAEREAARAEVEQRPTTPGASTALKVRPSRTSAGQRSADDPDSHNVSAGPMGDVNDSGASQTASANGATAAKENGAQRIPVSAGLRDQRDSTSKSLDNSADSKEPRASGSIQFRGVMAQAGVLILCLALGLGVIFVRRQWDH